MTEAEWKSEWEAVTRSAWGRWTFDGALMDEEVRAKSLNVTADVAKAVWREGMTRDAWVAATMHALGVPGPAQP